MHKLVELFIKERYARNSGSQCVSQTLCAQLGNIYILLLYECTVVEKFREEDKENKLHSLANQKPTVHFRFVIKRAL